jgi:hypothetical protein
LAANPSGLGLEVFVLGFSVGSKTKIFERLFNETWLESTAYIQCPLCKQVVKMFMPRCKRKGNKLFFSHIEGKNPNVQPEKPSPARPFPMLLNSPNNVEYNFNINLEANLSSFFSRKNEDFLEICK